MALGEFARLPFLFISDLRDVVIIIWGILSILLLVALIAVVVTLALSVRRLIKDINELLNSGVRPVLVSTRETVDNVTGTTRFVGDKVVSPIIRVISLVSGVRRGVAVFSGLTGRRGHDEDEKQ